MYAATRAAGAAFGPATQVSRTGHASLWPSAAITATGQAILSWVTNDSGGGSGAVDAAVGSVVP